MRDVDAVTKCRDVVDALMGIFLKFDFRNGALRKKYDGLKYTLKKMENTLYEMSLTSAAAKRSREDGDEATRRPGNGAAGTTKTNERGEERWGTMRVERMGVV